MFEGRLPTHLQDRAPKVVETPGATRCGSSRAQTYTQVGMNTVAGAGATEHGEARAVPLRADAAGLLRRRRPRARHGHQRRLGVGELPVDDHGVLRQGVLPARTTRSSAPRHPGMERLGATRSGGGPPRPDHPAGHHVAHRPRAGRRGDPSQRRARLHARSRCPSVPHADRSAVDLWTDHWDPIIQACADTDTVISRARPAARAGTRVRPAAPGAPLRRHDVRSAVARSACTEWLWSGLPGEHPHPQDGDGRGRHRLGGHALDRLDNIVDRSGYGLGWDERPADVLRRNFWFCTIDDPSTIDTRDRIGVENIMVEVDYPHGDSTWPDTQVVIEKAVGPPPRRRAAHDVQRERRRALPPPAPRGCPAVMTVVTASDLQ